jgi:hypothetical protein
MRVTTTLLTVVVSLGGALQVAGQVVITGDFNEDSSIAGPAQSGVQAGQGVVRSPPRTLTKKTSEETVKAFTSVDRESLASLLVGEARLTRSTWSGIGLEVAAGSWDSYADNNARMVEARKAAWSTSGLSESIGSWDSFRSDNARNDALVVFMASSGPGVRQGLRDLLGDLGYGGGMPGNNAGDPGGGDTSGSGTGGDGGSGGKGGKGDKGGKSDSGGNLGGLGEDALKLGDTDNGASIRALFPPRLPVQTQLSIMLGHLLMSGGG